MRFLQSVRVMVREWTVKRGGTRSQRRERQIVRSDTAQWLAHVQEEREGPATGKQRNTLLTMDC